jgi:hypothetical protein
MHELERTVAKVEMIKVTNALPTYVAFSPIRHAVRSRSNYGIDGRVR